MVKFVWFAATFLSKSVERDNCDTMPHCPGIEYQGTLRIHQMSTWRQSAVNLVLCKATLPQHFLWFVPEFEVQLGQKAELRAMLCALTCNHNSKRTVVVVDLESLMACLSTFGDGSDKGGRRLQSKWRSVTCDGKFRVYRTGARWVCDLWCTHMWVSLGMRMHIGQLIWGKTRQWNSRKRLPQRLGAAGHPCGELPQFRRIAGNQTLAKHAILLRNSGRCNSYERIAHTLPN